jgi:cobalt-zinc-cadmium efflux system outer membrane protein
MNRALNYLIVVAAGLWMSLPASMWAQTAVNRSDSASQSAAAPPSNFQHSNEEPRLNGAVVSLQELLSVALAQNPAIKSAAERFLAQRARVPQARSLPDLTVSGTWMGNITPFSVQRGDPSSYRGLTVAEDFPYPGKLKLRGQIADRDAEAARWDHEQTRRQVVADVKEAYYSYFYYAKAIEITNKDKDLLQKLERIAEALYRVGKGIQQDVLRAQVEVSRIDQKLTILHQEERTARVRLNTLLDRDPESPLPPPAAFTTADFHYTLDELYSMAQRNDPGLERDRRLIEGNTYAVNLAQKAYNPDFRVGYTYQQRPMMPDMHGFMVGINIPVFYRSKQRQGVIEATHDLLSSRRELESRLTTVNFVIKQQYLAATASRDLSNLYSKAIVPQASLALESSMSAYQVGKLDFLSLLENFINVLDYEVGYYQELSNFQIALARLEPLVGIELTR